MAKLRLLNTGVPDIWGDIPTADVRPVPIGFHTGPTNLTPIYNPQLPGGTGGTNPMNDWTPSHGDDVSSGIPLLYHSPHEGDPNYDPTNHSNDYNLNNDPTSKNHYVDRTPANQKKRSSDVSIGTGCDESLKNRIRAALNKAIDHLADDAMKILGPLRGCIPDLDCIINALQAMQDDASSFVQEISCVSTLPPGALGLRTLAISDGLEHTMTINAGAFSGPGSLSDQVLEMTLSHELLHFCGSTPSYGDGVVGCRGSSSDNPLLTEIDTYFLNHLFYPKAPLPTNLNIYNDPDKNPNPNDLELWGNYFSYNIHTKKWSGLAYGTDDNGDPLLKQGCNMDQILNHHTVWGGVGP
ncbi:MAG: hypothetical protein JSS75_07560 [Bacteroidetes bacterium]|nr:hypothetical protein [Bacteroidota bacterium]